MRTDTLAVVFTDLKGYTAVTSSQTHQENARMLRRVERVVTPVVHGYNGRVVKSIGDAYMIVFRSPTEAVRWAAAVQDRLHQHNTNTSADQAIHLRIALNFGEVRVHRGDVFGEPVNIAARLEGVTPADEIYLSEAVYLTMNRSEIATELVGAYELKGIPEPVTVYRVKKFAHLEEEEEEGAEADTSKKSEQAKGAIAAGLPFGGKQLSQWRKLRWLRRAYQAMWTVAVLGIMGAGYLRYRPSSDFRHLVVAARAAAEQGAPMDVLAAAGQIPRGAIEERNEVRRYRRKAVAMLTDRGDLDTAQAEVESLLAEDQRDAEALMLQGLLRHAQGELKAAIEDLEQALKLDPRLGEQDRVIEVVVDGYRETNTRKTADFLIANIIQKAAVSALARAVRDEEFGGRTARWAVASRLEKLGMSHEVDWVLLYVEDLKSTNCKIRKTAISKLSVEKDDRAVGPLIKVAEAKGCGASYARSVANLIVK